jgi:hypothetical protein
MALAKQWHCLQQKQRKEDAQAQHFHDNCAAVAARAPRKAATHANVLAASCRQKDAARTQIFASATAKSSCQEAVLCSALTQYKKSLAKYNAWFAAYNALKATRGTPALTERASANDKEAAGCLRDSTAVDMAAAVSIVNTPRHETAGAVQHQAVAERGTVLVLLPLGNKALAPTMPPSAPPMAVSSSPPNPTTYVGAVLSTMRGSPHVTSLALTPLPQPATTLDGHPWMVR